MIWSEVKLELLSSQEQTLQPVTQLTIRHMAWALPFPYARRLSGWAQGWETASLQTSLQSHSTEDKKVTILFYPFNGIIWLFWFTFREKPSLTYLASPALYKIEVLHHNILWGEADSKVYYI